jgi:hypothetical protein
MGQWFTLVIPHFALAYSVTGFIDPQGAIKKLDKVSNTCKKYMVKLLAPPFKGANHDAN